MNELLVCLPTYNHPTSIKNHLSILQECSELFDFRIFDSSDECFIEKNGIGNSNCQYYKFDSKIHSNLKMYKIFQQKDISKYKYIMVVTDKIFYSKELYLKILSLIKEDYDVIALNWRDRESLGIKSYCNKQNFFEDLAWEITAFGSVVLKVSTMLTNVLWDDLEKKYLTNDTINHSHVAFYFEQINRLNNFSAINFPIGYNDYKYFANIENIESGWVNDTFKVWCDCWEKMILKLPNDYKNKAMVIKKHGILSGLFKLDSFYEMRSKHIYSLRIFLHYFCDWGKYTDVTRVKLLICALTPSFLAEGKTQKSIEKKIYIKRIKKLCRNVEDIYIYGVGIKAKKTLELFETGHVKPKGFLVSEGRKKESEFMGYKVYEFTPQFYQKGKMGIVIAMNEENSGEVLRKYPFLKNDCIIICPK